ncbi:TPA: hypothetical protein ACF33U_004210 [Vibrio parahaemolyticus]
MSKVRVVCSPLTNIIYSGETTEDGMRLKSNKQDVTLDCLIAVVEHGLNSGSVIQIVDKDGHVDFEISVKDLRVKSEKQIANTFH